MLLRQIKALVDRQARLRKALTDALFGLLFGFWGNFRDWDDPDLLVANIARTTYAVESTNSQIRQTTRSYLTGFFLVADQRSALSVPLPPLENTYPRGEVNAFTAYARVADEYFYTKRKWEKNREEVQERIEELSAEVKKAAAGARDAKPVNELVREVKELDAKAQSPAEKRENAAAERRRRLDTRLAQINSDLAASREKRDADREKADALVADILEVELEEVSRRIYRDEEILQEARAKVQERIKKIADADVQMARMDESGNIIESQGDEIIGYRRVFHPEQSESGTCGLCIAASNLMYSKGDLEPMHFYCNCEVLPVTRDFDPGQQLNRGALDKLYEEAGGNDIDALSNTRYKLNENGELSLMEVVKTNAPALTVSERRKRNKNDRYFHMRRDMQELNTYYKTEFRLTKRYLEGETHLLANIQHLERRMKQLEKRLGDQNVMAVKESKIKPTKRSGASNSRATASIAYSPPSDASKRIALASAEKSLEQYRTEQDEFLSYSKRVGSTVKDFDVDRKIDRSTAIKFHEELVSRLKKELGIK